MNERIKELATQAGYKDFEYAIIAHKFAELIVKECARLNQEQSYELAGVIIDTEEGDGFDHVCLNTVKRVHDYLATDRLAEHFGVEL